jgi:hypothetical protein
VSFALVPAIPDIVALMISAESPESAIKGHPFLLTALQLSFHGYQKMSTQSNRAQRQKSYGNSKCRKALI